MDYNEIYNDFLQESENREILDKNPDVEESAMVAAVAFAGIVHGVDFVNWLINYLKSDDENKQSYRSHLADIEVWDMKRKQDAAQKARKRFGNKIYSEETLKQLENLDAAKLDIMEKRLKGGKLSKEEKQEIAKKARDLAKQLRKDAEKMSDKKNTNESVGLFIAKETAQYKDNDIKNPDLRSKVKKICVSYVSLLKTTKDETDSENRQLSSKMIEKILDHKIDKMDKDEKYRPALQYLKNCSKNDFFESGIDKELSKMIRRDFTKYDFTDVKLLATATLEYNIKNGVYKSIKEAAISESVQTYKSYPNTFIYSKKESGGSSTEQHLLNYIMKAERINKNSEAFSSIQNDIKSRQTSAILYRVLMMDNVVLAMSDKELPASFKVFRATDVRSNDKSPKIFIDVTGLVKLNSGYLVCKEIDKLCTYLTAALVHMLYYNSGRELTTNATITRLSTVCFVKMFSGVLDNLRVLGYAENQVKIKYIIAVYYLYSVVGKDLTTARNMAANIMNVPQKEAKAYDYYYEDENLNDIDSFITGLAETFKLKELTTDIVIDRWIFMYGKGTMYGLELYPVFLTILTNAYCGAYVNNQKTIEKFCGKDMVTVSTTIIRMGADVFQEGAHYVRDEDGSIVLV